MSELKPCPFCGGEAEIHQVGNEATRSRGFEVKCLTWGCATKKRTLVIRHSLEEARGWAITAWNRRAEPGWQPISSAPGDGTYIKVRSVATYRWTAYKPDGARQMKKAGRWQVAGEHGGWTNADLPEGADWQALRASPATPAHAELSPGNSSDLRGEEG